MVTPSTFVPMDGLSRCDMSDPTVITRCIEGAALAPLGARERQELARLARRAWDKVRSGTQESGNGNPEFMSSRLTDFDAWRHQQVMIACERAGLREARNEDYGLIKAHLLRIIGQDAMADRQVDRAQIEPRRVALHKLGEECKAAEDVIDKPLEYVSAIGRARYHGAGLDDLGEKQIWGLVFDLRRNAQRRRAKSSVAKAMDDRGRAA